MEYELLYIGVLLFSNKKYFLINKIGEGSTADVYKATDPSDNFHVAIKVFKKPGYYESEISTLKKLGIQNNIVKIYDFGNGKIIGNYLEEYGETIEFIILEYFPNGELFEYISILNKGFGEDFGRIIFSQILNAVQQCHNLGVIHGDIKTENILIDDNFNCQLADFGHSREITLNLIYTSIGTPGYFPPEAYVFKKGYKGPPVDIFSLGKILFIIVTGKSPFNEPLLSDIHYKYIIKNNYEMFWLKYLSSFPELSEEFKDLFVNLVNYHPHKRLDLKAIIDHPWVQNFNVDKQQIQKLLMDEFKVRKYIVDITRDARNGKLSKG